MKKDNTTEQKIKEAAKKVFIKKGLSGARMQDIADQAGINKALLHYYFRSKEKLFEIIFDESVQVLMPQLNSILEKDAPVLEKIKGFAAAGIRSNVSVGHIRAWARPRPSVCEDLGHPSSKVVPTFGGKASPWDSK